MSLKVYDVIGREVAELTNSEKAAGTIKLISMRKIYQVEFISILRAQEVLSRQRK
ncbi:MAG: hypothetical protein U5K00_01165 [Melioribacteraceae bacterium]|nr:hypothetical protein [Melioribacteraceae bacterium]